jgi:hypothetical protein
MPYRIKVDIALHPVAWKVLRGKYSYDGTAVDVGHGWLYSLIVQSLEHRHIILAGELKRNPIKMVRGAVYISERDYLHHGGYIRLSRQANISRAIYRMERDIMCNKIAVMYATTGIERNKIMRQILDEHDLAEDEMSFEALKKYYQRNYRQKEEDITNTIKELRN